MSIRSKQTELTIEEMALTLSNPWIEFGEEKGAQKIALQLLHHRVGDFSEQLEQQIQTLPLQKVEELSLELLNFTTIADLEKWLQENVPYSASH